MNNLGMQKVNDMDENISISVITYVKNGMPYIKECINSIRNQTLKNIEILVVDAGSTDGTEEYLKEICVIDDRIKILKSTPSVGTQFNKALVEAQGKYIAVCEADDYILPDAYEKLFYIASNEDSDVIRSDYFQFFNKEKHILRFHTHACTKKDCYEKKLELKDNFFLKEGINGFWNGLYRRQFLIDNDIKMNETLGASYQDIGFSFLCQYYAKSVYYSKEPFYCYRLDNPDASMNVSNRVDKIINEFVELQKKLKEKNIWNQCYQEFFEWEIQAVRKAYICMLKEEKTDIVMKIEKKIRDQIQEDNMQQSRSIFQKEIKELISEQDREIERIREYFLKIKEDKSMIVIFGAGFIGQIVSMILEKVYEKDFVVVDNDKAIQGTFFNCHLILSPEEVVKEYPGAVYMIANVNHAVEIMEQLIKMGVNKEKIYISNNDDILLRQILMKARIE